VERKSGDDLEESVVGHDDYGVGNVTEAFETRFGVLKPD